MSRFIAIRTIMSMDGRKSPGDAVPGAEAWAPHIQQSEVDMGNVYDLHRKVLVNPNHTNAVKREKALLEAMALDGITLEEAGGGRQVVRRSTVEPNGQVHEAPPVPPVVADTVPEAPPVTESVPQEPPAVAATEPVQSQASAEVPEKKKREKKRA